MNKLITILLLILGFLLSVGLIFYAIGSQRYDFYREAYINAPKEAVWEQVSTWKNNILWSPWVRQDTAMQKTISGTDGEVGSKFEWKSQTIGNGSQKIVESKPLEYRVADLVMEDWGMNSLTSFSLRDSGSGTVIRWRIWGENNWLGRMMSVFMKMEKMVAPDYEKGLAFLKNRCEKTRAPQTAYTLGAVRETDFPATAFITIRRAMSMDEFFKNSKQIFETAAGQLINHAEQNKLQIQGPLYGLYYKWDGQSRSVDMAVAFPVDPKASSLADIKVIKLPRMKAAIIDFYGAYEATEHAHNAIGAWLEKNNKQSTEPVMEEYVTDPATEKDQSKRLTRIWYPLK